MNGDQPDFLNQFEAYEDGTLTETDLGLEPLGPLQPAAFSVDAPHGSSLGLVTPGNEVQVSEGLELAVSAHAIHEMSTDSFEGGDPQISLPAEADLGQAFDLPWGGVDFPEDENEIAEAERATGVAEHPARAFGDADPRLLQEADFDLAQLFPEAAPWVAPQEVAEILALEVDEEPEEDQNTTLSETNQARDNPLENTVVQPRRGHTEKNDYPAREPQGRVHDALKPVSASRSGPLRPSRLPGFLRPLKRTPKTKCLACGQQIGECRCKRSLASLARGILRFITNNSSRNTAEVHCEICGNKSPEESLIRSPDGRYSRLCVACWVKAAQQRSREEIDREG